MTPRLHFDEQLAQLDRELLRMGALIEKALKGATGALADHDTQLAKRIIESDKEVNRKERDIESLCLKLLLQQQPVARDLRTISAALKMITDMERIGDQAADICEIICSSAEALPLERVGNMLALGEATLAMVNSAIDAFVERSVESAREVMQEDKRVDQLFCLVRKELLALIRETEDADEAAAIDLLMIAKYFERIGDHAQNIAEWVEYSLTGMHKDVLLG
jgi:phosphate transport system protein